MRLSTSEDWMINRRNTISKLLKENSNRESTAYDRWTLKEAWYPLLFWMPSREKLKAEYVFYRDLSLELAFWRKHLKDKINTLYSEEAKAIDAKIADSYK